MTRTSITRITLKKAQNGQIIPTTRRDTVATEEPLEIRLVTGTQVHQIAVTMRTPSHDFELATGFLFNEGIIQAPDDITHISYCVDRDLSASQRYNVVNVKLRHDTPPSLDHLERHFFTTSACGVCGKTSIDALETRGLQPLPDNVTLSPTIITTLDNTLRQHQQLFDRTGGLHAVGIFDNNGQLKVVREDVGRHNAMDKVIGWAYQQRQLPLDNAIALVSGRASFELVQKALVARIPILCAVSAPSSLAIDLARRFNLTLIGFLRGDSFNIYTGEQRLLAQESARHFPTTDV